MTNSISAVRRLAAPAAFLLLLLGSASAWAATISGRVFNDLNGSGTFDVATETGLGSVEVTFRNNPTCDDNVADDTAIVGGTVTTSVPAGMGTGGTYTSPALAIGCYSVTVNDATGDLAAFTNDGQFHGLTTRIYPFVVRLTKNTSVYNRANFGYVDVPLQIIEHTAPNLVVDSNGYATGAGPNVFTIGTQVCNNTAVDRTDVVAHIGSGNPATATPYVIGDLPDTVCAAGTCTVTTASGGSGATWSNGGTYSGTFQLQLLDLINNGDVSDATRYLGTVPANTCVGAYWQVQYELVDGANNPTFGASNNPLDDLRYEWLIWAEAPSTPPFYLRDGATVRSEQSASANKIQPNPGGYTTIDGVVYNGATLNVVPGQVIEVAFVNATFGTIGAGFDAANDGNYDYDFWFQPIGENYVNPDLFRMLSSEVTINGTCGGSTFNYTNYDNTYSTDVDRFSIDGPSCGATGTYKYKFIILGPQNATISPYQEAGSGADNEKYNGDYCGDNPAGFPAVCVSFQIAQGIPSITKDVDKTSISTPGPDTLTYTLSFSNPGTTAVGAPEPTAVVIYDTIPLWPTYATFVGGSAAPGCVPATFAANATGYTPTKGCRVEYSTDGLLVGNPLKVWTSTPPAAASVTQLKFILLDAVGAASTGKVSYQLLVDPSFHGVVQNIADIRIDTGDIIVQDDALTCIRNTGDCLTVSTVALVSGFGGFAGTTGGATVWWDTASESGTVGYHLERLDSVTGKYVRVNDSLLPGLLDSPAGGHYELADPGAIAGQTYAYRLVEVEQSGRENTYGPYRVTFAADGSTTNVVNGKRERRAPADSAGGYFSQSHEATALHKARTEARKKTVSARKVARSQEHGSVYRLAVRDEGLYFVDLDTLGLDPKRVSLTNKGAQVATFASGRGVYFYGTGIDSAFTRDNIYYLSAGKGLKMATDRGGRVGRRDTAGTSFTDKVHVEEDKMPVTILTTDPSTDWWYQALIVAGNPATPFDVPAYGAVAGQPARLAISLQGIRDTVPGNDQRARVTLNGSTLGEVAWDGATAKVAEFDVPAGIVVDGINTVTVAGVLDSGVPYSLFLVDSIDLGYSRAFLAREDRLRAQAGDDSAVEIAGFSDRDVMVLDISSANAPVMVSGARVDSGSGGFTVSFRQDAPRSRYFATTRAAVPVLVPQGVDTPSNLKGSSGAQYVIVAPGELKAAAQRLADYRASQGLTSLVVDLEDIYDEFNHGIASPQAIRDFFAYATQNWAQKPRYGVLAGNGSYDYRDLLEQGDNLVPVWLAPTPNGLFAADNRFGDVSGNDGVPEVRMGRVPVLNADELNAYVDRVIAWEGDNGSWTSRVLFAADDVDAGGAFMGDSQDISQRLPAGYQASNVFLDNLLPSVDNARSQLQQRWSEGRVYANWIGHGGTDRWASEGMLVLGDTPLLNAGVARPIVASMTCSISRFEPPGYTSLGEELVLSAVGGAIASWAPSGQSINSEAKILNGAFVDALFAGGNVRLGDAVQSALAHYHAAGDLGYIVDIYNLLGDPALKMKAPPPQ